MTFEHFNGNFNNADSLKAAFKDLPETYQPLIEKDKEYILEVFEEIFDHKSFTGRSGTFFGYEGLGSIYWHMVSKLLLAVQENCLLAINSNEDEKIIGRLLDHYYEINAGIGVHKSPDLYGAFPTDAYSHTPANKGAQQPGMTGQVKEDLLSRFGELGVFVTEGKIVFKPRLLKESEFLTSSKTFDFISVSGTKESITVNQNQLCFTYCQVPIIYTVAEEEKVVVTYNSGNKKVLNELALDEEISNELFNRTNNVKQIEVFLTK